MENLTTSKEIIKKLQAERDPERAKHSLRFFKTGKGEYGEGDIFYGLTLPYIRSIAKHSLKSPLPEIQKLIYGKYHEERLIGFIILTEQFKKADSNNQKEILDFYLTHAEQANNWDLVDSSAHKIVGQWIVDHPKDISIIYDLSKTKNLWKERISVVATLMLIQHKWYEPTIKLSKFFLNHKHDLMHKACGWALREVGKKDLPILIEFLDTYTTRMPRTMLRYSIEKLPETQRKYYLGLR